MRAIDLPVSNGVGADILNVPFVVGLSACATELKLSPMCCFLHLPVMVLLLIYAGYAAALVVFAPHMAGR